MKIAVVTPTFPPYKGGMGNSAYNIALPLSVKNGVEIFTPTQISMDRKNEMPFPVHYIKPLLRLGQGAFVSKLFKVLNSFDMIYLHYPFFGGAEVVWLYKILHPKKKLIIHFHMDNPALTLVNKFLSVPSLLVKRSLFKSADKIICASLDYAKHSSISNYIENWPDKFCEIPFGVNFKKFYSLPYDLPELKELKTKHGLDERTKVILFVGGLDGAHSFKGIDILLKAFVQIAQRVSYSAKLIICGDGDLRQEYETQANKVDIADKVIFTDRVRDQELVYYYNLADVFVLPSVDSSEAFGLVLLEALACGTPVVASSLPGVRSVFEKGKQGLFAQPRDEDDLAEKINEILSNDLKRQAMGNAARELAEKKYDWRRVAEQLEEVINQL